MSRPADPLTLDDTGSRAVGGAALLLARAAVVLVLGVGANVLLARMLTPRDFGLVALGSVLLVAGTFLSDTGLAAGLIRRAEEPTRRELEALNALQIAATAALAVCAAAVGAAVGRDGLVVATMLAGLPILMLKVPSVVVLERRLEYGRIATVDVVEALVFYAWALVTVALGAGVWGFATAVVARSVAGVAAMARLGPVGLVRPRWSWPLVQPVIGFGAKFQAVYVIQFARDQSLNVAIAVISGLATLGVWNLAWRVLQVPFVIFGNLGRIGFPAMARLLNAGRDPRAVIERGGAAIAVLSGVTMVALVGVAPALPAVLGPGWHDVPAVLLWAGLTLIAAFPIVLSSSPFLFASDAGGSVIRALLLGAAVWLGVALPLLPSLGAPAAAVGWCAGGVVHLTMLAASTRARTGAQLGTSVGLPVVVGIAAATAGWLVTDAAGRTVAAGLVGVGAGEALLFVALLAVRRPALRDTRGLVTAAIGTLTGRPVRAAASTGSPS